MGSLMTGPDDADVYYKQPGHALSPDSEKFRVSCRPRGCTAGVRCQLIIVAIYCNRSTFGASGAQTSCIRTERSPELVACAILCLSRAIAVKLVVMLSKGSLVTVPLRVHATRLPVCTIWQPFSHGCPLQLAHILNTVPAPTEINPASKT